MSTPPAWPLAELIVDNPFFVRALRQSRRTLHQVAWGGGVGLALMLGLVVLFYLAPGGLRTALSQYPLLPALSLAGVHALICAGAAGSMRGALAGEVRAGTFRQLLLLPWPLGLLLGAKLVHPLWCLVVAWLAGSPIYVVTALLGLAPMGLLEAVAPIPLLLGLIAIILEFMDELSLRRLKSEAGGDPSPKPVSASYGLTQVAPLWALVFAAYRDGISTMPGGWSAPRLLFLVVLPRWGFWALFLGVLGAMAAGTTLWALSSTEIAERAATRVRRLASGALYLLVLGSLWTLLPAWQRWVGLFGIPAGGWLLVTLFRWIVPPRRTDPLSAAEVAWFIRRWDNPVLLRDLRSDTRFLSMRRAFVRRTGVIVLSLAGLFIPLAYGGLGSFIPWEELVYGAGLSAAGFLFFYPAAHASVAWSREYPGQAAALLLLAPISTADLLRGRAFAATTYCWTINGALWLIALSTAGWAIWQGRWASLLAIVALGPLFLPGLVGSWSLPDGRGENRWTTGLTVSMCTTGLSSWILAFNSSRLSAPVNLLLAVLLFAANWWQARQYYRVRLVELERFRREQLELLDRARAGS